MDEPVDHESSLDLEHALLVRSGPDAPVELGIEHVARGIRNVVELAGERRDHRREVDGLALHAKLTSVHP